MGRDELLDRLAIPIHDPRVLEAVRAVPREVFVPEDLRADAWLDEPLPIGRDQTISQPSLVARMCEILGLTGDEIILDVGGGSGYHAALLGHLGREVISIERHADLAEGARRSLFEAGVDNVEVVMADGSAGYPDRAPYGAINVAAGADRIPPVLLDQLAEDGRLLAPVGTPQILTRVTRSGEKFTSEPFGPVRFVPLVED